MLKIGRVFPQIDQCSQYPWSKIPKIIKVAMTKGKTINQIRQDKNGTVKIWRKQFKVWVRI